MRKGGSSARSLVMLAIAIGAGYHIALSVRPKELLADRPFRDDTFYALTIARNLAMGNGLSTADGEIPTNGFQPLFVFVSSLPYFITHDKYFALRLVHVILLLVHLGSALAVYRLTGLFSEQAITRWTAVALWMVSFPVLQASANGLETGLYLLMILCATHFYLASVWESSHIRSHLMFGCLLGITTLTRIDGGFLCLAFAFHYLIFKRTRSGDHPSALLKPVIWFGPWLLLTLPWWVYNRELTGSIVPTSGHVLMLYRSTTPIVPRIVENLNFSLHALLDQSLVVMVTPLRFIKRAPYWAVIWIVVRLAFLILVAGWIRRKAAAGEGSPHVHAALAKVAFFPLFLTFLFIYYNFFFNASWYLSRYLCPFLIASVVSWSLLVERHGPRWRCLALAAAIAATLFQGAVTYWRPLNSMYAEHYGWVREKAADDTWVAALNSGTLGYFHDKTINADGKVNPDIRRLAPGTLGRYLADKNVDYLIEGKPYFQQPLVKGSDLSEYYVFQEEYAGCQVWRRKGVPGMTRAPGAGPDPGRSTPPAESTAGRRGRVLSSAATASGSPR